LNKSKVRFASNRDTMPSLIGVGFGFVVISLAKLGKKQLCQSKWLCKPPMPANK
jgi:hypothetical protein